MATGPDRKNGSIKLTPPVERISPRGPATPAATTLPAPPASQGSVGTPIEISGRYRITLAITDTSSPFHRGLLSQRTCEVELTSQRYSLELPLPDLLPTFEHPVVLNINGWQLNYLGMTRIRDFPQTDGNFNGAFSPDGSQLNLQFELSTKMFTLSGRVTGTRL
jgi:hypothetical protein